MNTTETAVLKAFLISDVGFNEAEYDSLWKKATTSPSGRVIDDYTEITELAASMSVSASDKKTYFKYTEMLQWALNEKDFPGAGGSSIYSPPNLSYVGKYNIDMSGSGTNYTSKVLNWDSNPSNWERGWVRSWDRSKYNDGDYYVEDQTEYISDAEAQCIMAFWFGIDSTQTNAKAFAAAFLKACIVPTYLDEDGAGVLVNAIYDKLQTSGSSFTVAMTDGVPQVSILDYSVEGVNNYLGLTSFVVSGSVSSNKLVLPAFITTSSVNGCFNRVTKLDADRTETKLTKFVMKACTSGYTTLELTTLSRLTDVSHMDFSYNNGISSIGDVLNLDIKKISYLDVYGVNVSGKYLEYVLENIKVNNTSATIYYNNNTVHTAYTATTTSTSDELRFLKELTNVDSPYLLLANKVNVGNGDKTVQWYVNEGNPAYLVDHACVDNFDTVATAEAMGMLMSNYYACTNDVTVKYKDVTYNLQKNNVYKISYIDGTNPQFVFTKIGTTLDGVVTETPDVNNIDWTVATVEKKQTSEQISATNDADPIYTSLTFGNLKTESDDNNYSTIVPLTYGWWGYRSTQLYFGNSSMPVYAVYSIKKTVKVEYVYRFYPNGVRCITKHYLKDNSVVDVEYTESDYLEFSVTEYRTYTLYFAHTSNSNVSTNTNLSQILNSSIGTSSNTQSDFESFRVGSTSGTKYVYRENGHAIYSVSDNGCTASFSTDTTFSGSSVSAVKASMENELSKLTSTDSAYIANIKSDKSYTENTFITYTNPIVSTSDLTNAMDKATAAMDRNNYVLYKYTGTTVTDSPYVVEGESRLMSCTQNQGYRLRFTAGSGSTAGYSFTTISLVENAAAVNMQAILTEANLHINDGLFGNYYGNYYCYNGDTRTIDGVTYTNGYVYRLMLNSDRTSFYFEYGKSLGVKETFTICETADDFMDALVNALNGSVDCLQEGAIVYYKGDQSTYYAKGLFELTRNEQTLTYYFKSMGGLGNQTSPKDTGTFMLSSITGQNLSINGISKFTNIRYIGSDTTNYYSGTGGSEQVEVVARIVDGDTVYERYFLVTVSA